MKSARPWSNLILSMAATVMIAASAQAQTASHVDTPLMVVRFNQERIYYQQPLFSAVSRALEAKPDVKFNVVSLVPETGKKRADKKLAAEARLTTEAFIGDMIRMGIPQSRIHVSYQPGPYVKANEVHLFVE